MNPNEKKIVFEPDRFYAVIDVAIGLNVGQDTVRRLHKNKQLPAMTYPKAGGKGKNAKLMFDGADVLRFIERCKAAKAA